MIEIAISIGVIGFALVAIIGILPRGMNVQQENRENTVVSQDAPYFMNAIRNGEMRTNGGILTNYVESITIVSTNSAGATLQTTYNNTALTGVPGNNCLTNDMAIIGYLSTPECDPRSISPYPGMTNNVTAIVRAMSGSALQQSGANAVMAFRYQMTVEIAPWNYATPGYATNVAASASTNYLNYMGYMAANLYEIRLRFAWPVLPNGSVGPNRLTYRSLVGSHLLITNVYGNNPNTYWYFFQPQTFLAATNS